MASERTDEIFAIYDRLLLKEFNLNLNCTRFLFTLLFCCFFTIYHLIILIISIASERQIFIFK